MKNKFTQEQLEELKKCRSFEEAKEFAKNSNIELSDDDLKNTVGGWYRIPYIDELTPQF